MRKIGLFGGTFDPIHKGHLTVAKSAVERFGLELVIFIPSGQPPHKTEKQVSPKEIRYKMTELATEDFSCFALSDYELKQPSLSYSVDTIKHFMNLYPNDAIYFIIGADSFADLPTWQAYRELMGLCCFIVISRPDTEKEKLLARFHGDETPPQVFFIDHIFIDISSTKIREMVKNGEDVSGLLSPKVYQYIRKKSLYREF